MGRREFLMVALVTLATIKLFYLVAPAQATTTFGVAI